MAVITVAVNLENRAKIFNMWQTTILQFLKCLRLRLIAVLVAEGFGLVAVNWTKLSNEPTQASTPNPRQQQVPHFSGEEKILSAKM
ncbi:hypothetical protein [Piscirickettsia salmonis]|uniref:hypothetical protein n=1 Tax=Piscirickettsia salmonis TaxID=1238 RepID=UPI0026D6ADBD